LLATHVALPWSHQHQIGSLPNHSALHHLDPFFDEKHVLAGQTWVIKSFFWQGLYYYICMYIYNMLLYFLGKSGNYMFLCVICLYEREHICKWQGPTMIVQYDSLDMLGYIHVCMHARMHDHACLRNSKLCEKYMHNIYTCMDSFILF
jgi:hypothetical protein